MTEEFDPNKIATEFLQQNIDKFFETGRGIIKAATDKIRLYLDSTYKEYIKTLLERHSKVRSFFIRNEPAYLYEFYVPLDLLRGFKRLKGSGIMDIIKISPFALITGSAGSGKSLIMRHLLIDTLLIKEKVPIFVELRQINQNGGDLRQLINRVLYANKFRLGEVFVEKALSAGQFALFLDGFDEVNLSKRQNLSQEIIKLAEYYDNWILVSSRPDNALEGWHGFSKFGVAPLTLDQAYLLIEKLPFDDGLKSKFQIDLRAGLFEKHRSFLSNPLLLSIMLLTYGQGAHIPTKLNVFYNQAYEALFQRHDALKGGFQRESRTQFDIQDFASVFSAFSLQTYDKHEIEFSRMQALDYIGKAKKITQLEFNNNDYLNDVLQAVCLLVEDGLMVVFTHRSFQEYFTARFIAEAKTESQKRLIEKYSKHAQTDVVMKLLYEIRPDIVERYYLIPNILNLSKEILANGEVDLIGYTQYLKKNIGELILKENSLSASIKNPAYHRGDLVPFVLENCGYLVDWKGFKTTAISSNSLWKKYGQGKTECVIKTTLLYYEDQFVKDLSTINTSLFSIEALRAVLKIGQVLEEKRKATEASLAEILGC